MSFYNYGILDQLTNTTAGYNVLSTSVLRPTLNIINFSNASSGYNIVVPAVDVNSVSTVRISGIDSASTGATLYIGANTSVMQIGNISTTTFVYGNITEINSSVTNIGLLSNQLNLGNISSQLVNISVANTSTSNIRIANISAANISVANISTSFIVTANISAANISAANISILTCANLSAIVSRVCNAAWFASANTGKNTNIGNGSPYIIQTTIINNASSLIQLQNPYEYDGTFKCAYDGMYLCSVIATPVDNTTPAAVYLSKNNNCIGPLLYGSTANSLSGSMTIQCNANDILAFYNFGSIILPGNSTVTKTYLQSLSQTNAVSAQMCSITLL